MPVKDTILILTSDPQINMLLGRMLRSFGFETQAFEAPEAIDSALQGTPPALIILSESLRGISSMPLAEHLIQRLPATPVLLLVTKDTPDLLKRALQTGVSDYLCLPLRSEEVLRAVQNSLDKARQRKEWVLLESRRTTASLQQRMDELEVLAQLGRAVTSLLELDSILSAVVDAAVQLTNAEEGSLLLLDEETNELYMRASRNFQEEFVRTFRLPVSDTLAGSVMSSGQSVLLDEDTPQKIKTSYLVQSLIYVPLQVQGHVIGVLGVDNRNAIKTFNAHDVQLLNTLAEYAVVAIENSRLYATTILERNKLETILTRIQDGVIVIDTDERLVMINPAAQAALNLTEVSYRGRPVREVISQPDVLELIDVTGQRLSNRTEFTAEDGRVFSVQLTPIPEVGIALTLYDITYLRKLDRIKSDFVSTVSHDLRSPLTAILGYVELMERAGPVTEMQREFIRRVQSSVQSITNLVNDLVNLGQIEAGFDARKESLDLPRIMQLSAAGMEKILKEKGLTLALNIPDGLPTTFGNPVQMRQMIEHLLDNAVKYSKPGGSIDVAGTVEMNQIILRFSDTGVGIPPADLPHIFEKFYRSSNVSGSSSGTGLGLAIVRSIAENHNGRIWVDSTPGKGTTFTIVLPLPAAD